MKVKNLITATKRMKVAKVCDVFRLVKVIIFERDFE